MLPDYFLGLISINQKLLTLIISLEKQTKQKKYILRLLSIFNSAPQKSPSQIKKPQKAFLKWLPPCLKNIEYFKAVDCPLNLCYMPKSRRAHLISAIKENIAQMHNIQLLGKIIINSLEKNCKLMSLCSFWVKSVETH